MTQKSHNNTPRHAVVAEVTCKDLLAGQHIVTPDSSLMFENPNLKFESMCYNNPEETQAKILPVILEKPGLKPIHTYTSKGSGSICETMEEGEVAYAEIARNKKFDKIS